MENFKDLRVWVAGVKLATAIYKITKTKPFANDYGLSNQIQRAAVSISSNIAEGDERGTNRQSVYYFFVAKGSAAEVITQLNIAHNIGYIDSAIFADLESRASQISASLNSLIKARGGFNPLNTCKWFILSIFLPI